MEWIVPFALLMVAGGAWTAYLALLRAAWTPPLSRDSRRRLEAIGVPSAYLAVAAAVGCFAALNWCVLLLVEGDQKNALLWVSCFGSTALLMGIGWRAAKQEAVVRESALRSRPELSARLAAADAAISELRRMAKEKEDAELEGLFHAAISELEFLNSPAGAPDARWSEEECRALGRRWDAALMAVADLGARRDRRG